MKTKTILSIAIMSILPLTAHATDPAVGPAHANSGAVVATASAPYVTQTPTADDATHIASTAYVKGAYNDAIAAVNNVDSKKQATLTNADNEDISDEVLSTGTELDGGRTDFIQVGGVITGQDDGEFDTIYSGISEDVGGLDDKLITAGAIIQLVHGAGKSLQDNIYDIAGDMINEQRVEIYTTWENDNAKQQVAFVTAQ